MKFSRGHIFYEADGAGGGGVYSSPYQAQDNGGGGGSSNNGGAPNPFDAIFEQGLGLVTNEASNERSVEIAQPQGDDGEQSNSNTTPASNVSNNAPQPVSQQINMLDNVINNGQRQQQLPQQQKPVVVGVDWAQGPSQTAYANYGGQQQQQPITIANAVGANQQQAPAAAAPQPYTPQEFSLAMQLNTVDEQRVPAEYRNAYAAQRQQQMNAADDTDAETVAANRDKMVAAEREFYSQLDQEARKRAMEALDITQEELDSAEYADDEALVEKVQQFDTAVQWHKNNLMNGIQQANQRRQQEEYQKQQEHVAVLTDAATYIQQLKSTEPNFDQIDQYMTTRFKNLPYEQAQPIANVYAKIQANPSDPALTREDTETLRKYYEATRLEYYAMNNNVTVNPSKAPGNPPYVERPVAGGAGGEATPDFNSLGSMDNEGKEEFIKKYLFG